MTQASTLFDKLWNEHEVVPETTGTPAVLYIDLHIIHEVTTPQAFSLLREKGLSVRRTDLQRGQGRITPADELRGGVSDRVGGPDAELP